MITFEQVRDAVTESLCSDEELTPKTRLIELCDSLDTAQLILDLEDAFKVEIPDDDLHKIFTLSDIVDYVNRKLA